mgnify:CR=1 FL=1
MHGGRGWSCESFICNSLTLSLFCGVLCSVWSRKKWFHQFNVAMKRFSKLWKEGVNSSSVPWFPEWLKRLDVVLQELGDLALEQPPSSLEWLRDRMEESIESGTLSQKATGEHLSNKIIAVFFMCFLVASDPGSSCNIFSSFAPFLTGHLRRCLNILLRIDDVMAREEALTLHKNQDIMYELTHVVVHGGCSEVGHYWIYVFDHSNDLWMRFNDTLVSSEVLFPFFFLWPPIKPQCLLSFTARKERCW